MMIISNIDSSSTDSSIDSIIRRVLAEDLSILPDGISEICGEDIFVNRVRTQAQSVADSMAEMHQEYVDIHLTLSGTETIGFCVESEDSTAIATLPFKNDCELKSKVANEQFITLEQGQYCVFYPYQWHRPMVSRAGYGDEIDKVVIKVRASKL